MTREEAIAILKTPIHCADKGDEKEMRDALEMAIKALSQEPCDDAISREELLKAIDTWDKFGVDDTNSLFRLDNLSLPYYVPYIHYDDVIKCIKGMPSVTQNPKYWIDKDNKLYKMPDDIPTMTIQYPTITHGDTISRTEVMKVISDFVTFEKYIDKHNHITFEPLEKMINALPSVIWQTECLKAQAKKQAMPMSCDDCCYEPNSPFCEMYRKDICEKKDERQSGKWIDYSDEGYVECPFCGHATNGEWVDVNERLPEEYGEYLITWKNPKYSKTYIGICECEITDVYDHEHNRFEVEWLFDGYITTAYPDSYVVAWQPLPEPYQKGGE